MHRAAATPQGRAESAALAAENPLSALGGVCAPRLRVGDSAAETGSVSLLLALQRGAECRPGALHIVCRRAVTSIRAARGLIGSSCSTLVSYPGSGSATNGIGVRPRVRSRIHDTSLAQCWDYCRHSESGRGRLLRQCGPGRREPGYRHAVRRA